MQNYVRSQFPDQRADPLTAPAPDRRHRRLSRHPQLQRAGALAVGLHQHRPAPNGTALANPGPQVGLLQRLRARAGHRPLSHRRHHRSTLPTANWAWPPTPLSWAPPSSRAAPTFENTILPDNLPALLYAAKVARTPYLTPAGPDALDLAATPGAVDPRRPGAPDGHARTTPATTTTTAPSRRRTSPPPSITSTCRPGSPPPRPSPIP